MLTVHQEKARIQRIQRRRYPIMNICRKINHDQNIKLSRRLKAQTIANKIEIDIQSLWNRFYNKE